jgi:formylglycine-generating enzyme required for sulfatase activity
MRAAIPRGLRAGLAALLAMSLQGGCVSHRCYEDRDCPAAQTCSPTGACIIRECDTSHPCGAGLECVANRCQPIPAAPITCPADMVSVAGGFCADKYEASRPDATASSSGRDVSRAMSVAGVLPWPVADNAMAAQACTAAGKRLCSAEEWRIACKGSDGTVYAYGDSYDPAICNGIDAFGRQSFHLAPTGSFPGCTNEWGLFDINGNLWEHVAGGSDMTVRGGAYNCNDSAALHKCDYVPANWTPSARGFRCCLTPTGGGTGVDGGPADADAQADGQEDGAGADVSSAPAESGGGCVDDGGAGAPEGMAVEAGPDTSGGASDGPLLDGGVADTPLADDAPVADGAEAGEASAPCPPEMAPVGPICVDRYEASRADATATSAGTSESVARSRAGVLPWYVNPMSPAALATFASACQAAGKRLCTSAEWLASCQGPGQTKYAFGNAWDPAICNSDTTHCQECCDILGVTDCPTGEDCGYVSTLSSSYTPETCFVSAPYGKDTCHVCFHVMPTGAMPGCASADGLFDVNGNVWEVVPVPTSEDSRGFEVRGGAFNCGSPSLRFACTFNAGWNDLYAGFRCCQDRR